MKKYLAILTLLLLTGCQLPSGDPPAGKIVSNPVQAEITHASSPADAVEKVIPELTAALLSECPCETVAVDADAGLQLYAQKALRECGKLTGNRCVLKGVCRLQLHAKGNSWQWKLFRHSRKVWEKTVILQKR